MEIKDLATNLAEDFPSDIDKIFDDITSHGSVVTKGDTLTIDHSVVMSLRDFIFNTGCYRETAVLLFSVQLNNVISETLIAEYEEETGYRTTDQVQYIKNELRDKFASMYPDITHFTYDVDICVPFLGTVILEDDWYKVSPEELEKLE